MLWVTRGYRHALVWAIAWMWAIGAMAVCLPNAKAAPALPSAPGAETSAERAASVLIERGVHYEGQGRVAAALRAYTEAVQLAPTSHRALTALAHARWRLGDYREAELLFKRLVALGYSTPDVVTRLALLAEGRGDRRNAEALRAVLCWSNPTRGGEKRAEHDTRAEQYEACERLAQVYEQQGSYVAALQVWRFIRSRDLRVAPETSIHIAALQVLAGELDPVQSGNRDRGWVRHLLYRVSLGAGAFPQ